MEGWKHGRGLKQYCVVRKPDKMAWPAGMDACIAKENSKLGQAGDRPMELMGNERALLSCLLARFHKLDPDVIVGHNVSAFDVPTLLHRC